MHLDRVIDVYVENLLHACTVHAAHTHLSVHRAKWSLSWKNVYLFSNKSEENNKQMCTFLVFDVLLHFREMENAIFIKLENLRTMVEARLMDPDFGAATVRQKDVFLSRFVPRSIGF